MGERQPARRPDAVVVIVAALAVLLAVMAAGQVAAAVLETSDRSSEAWVGDAAPGESRETAQTLTLTERTFANVFRANDTVEIGVETDAETVRWTVHDYGGRLVANGTTTVGGEAALTLPTEGVGHYVVRVRTTGTPANEARTSVAVLPADDFENRDRFYGMNSHMNSQLDYRVAEIMDAMGVATVRETIHWHEVERERGVYDFSGRNARTLDAVQNGGMEPLPILAYGNELHVPEWYGWSTAPYTDDSRRAYADYGRAVSTYSDEVRAVEVWNEYDHGVFSDGPAAHDPANYSRLLEATYPRVTAARSNLTVVAGATAYPSFDWWERVFEHGGGRYMDAMSIHPYRESPRGLDRDVRRLEALAREYNDGEAFPVWVTELGWPTGPAGGWSVGERRQAQYLVRSHARLRDAGVERLYWFNIQTVRSPSNAGGEGGLLRHPDHPQGGSTPRPAVVAYAVMTRQLAGLDHVTSQRLGPVESHRYTDGSRQTRVLWTNAANVTDLTVHTDDAVVVTTVTGDSQRLHPVDGEVYLSVGQDPLYLTGNVSELTRGAPVDVRPTGNASAGERRVLVSLRSDDDGPQTATHRVGDRTTTVSVTAQGGDESALELPTAYRRAGATVVDTVSVENRTVGRLLTTVPQAPPSAQFGANPSTDGMDAVIYHPNDGVSAVERHGVSEVGFDLAERGGVSCYESDVDAGDTGQLIRIRVDDTRLYNVNDTVSVTVRYFDEESGQFSVHYDHQSAGRVATDPAALNGSGTWQTRTFTLQDAQFADGINGYDLRLSLWHPDVGTSSGDVCFESIAVGDSVPPPNDASDATAIVTDTATATDTDTATATATDDATDESASRNDDEDDASPTADDSSDTSSIAETGTARTDVTGESPEASTTRPGTAVDGSGFGLGVAVLAVLGSGILARRAGVGE